MHVTFVESRLFTLSLGEYLSDDEYIDLQNTLANRPEAGKIITGTGGLRKLRFALSSKSIGKRGGLRVIYYWYTNKKRIYLLALYYKGETADLTARDKTILKQLMEVWKHEQT